MYYLQNYKKLPKLRLEPESTTKKSKIIYLVIFKVYKYFGLFFVRNN